MSEKLEDQEYDKTATNRLLDLLRSQQAGESLEETQSPGDDSESIVKPKPVKNIPPPGNDVDTATGSEDAKPGPTSTVRSMDLLEKFKTSMTGRPKKSDLDSDSLPAGGSTQAPSDAEKSKSGRSATDLLQNLQPAHREPVEEVEVDPPAFDTTLFTEAKEQVIPPFWQAYANVLFHGFNDSMNLLTINAGEKILILMEIRYGAKGTTITNYSRFILPFDDGTQTIKTMEELIPIALDRTIEKKSRRKTFVAFYSADVPVKTYVLQTPLLKGKELGDLVNWNLKKKQSIDTENSIFHWEALPVSGKNEKQNVVVATVATESVKPVIDLIHKSKLNIRYQSALPVMLWKLFTRDYPDRQKGCQVLVHLGETHADVMFIVNHALLFSREIVLGLDDFYTAVMQKVIVGDKTIEIDLPTARQIVNDYGIPEQGNGLIAGSKISLYKISIFLRPVVERLTSELSRSLKYFNKLYPDLEWEELIFDGPGAAIPNLLTTLKNNLNVNVSLFHPQRVGTIKTGPGVVIPENELPEANLNFALAEGRASRINLLPRNLVSASKFIFFNKVAIAAAIFLIPLFLGSIYFSYRELNEVKKNVVWYQNEWTQLNDETKGYYDLLNDRDILKTYGKYLHNDEVLSQNQIKLMKLFSGIVPTDIKFTSMVFSKEIQAGGSDNKNDGATFQDILRVKGFIQAEAAVADIRLTNFVIKLEEMEIFSDVEFKMDENSKPKDGKLFFKVDLRLKA